MKAETDYYAILQVSPVADPEVIQAAYRRLAARYHPDVNHSPDSSSRMKLLNAAYEVLSDPAKRQAYDRSRIEAGRQTAKRTPGRRGFWWTLLPAIVIVLILLRLNVRLSLIGSIIFAIWFILNWQRQGR